jgi:hypothetical protein
MQRVEVLLFSLAVEAKTKISLASAQGGVDQRKSPGWHARNWCGYAGGDTRRARRSPLPRRGRLKDRSVDAMSEFHCDAIGTFC